MDFLKSMSASGGLSATGTVLSAGSQIAGGVAARRGADFQASQADIAAGQTQAASQRTAAEQERQAKLLASRAQAVAAASGGGASDPTVLDIIGKIAGEGSYRSQLALYEGNDTARALHARADASRFEGRSAQMAGFVGAGATLFEKYGKKKASGSTGINWDLESGMG